MSKKLKKSDISRIIHAEHHDPFDVLGMHPIKSGNKKNIVVRCFIPGANKIDVVIEKEPKTSFTMKKVHDDGFFEAIINKSDFFSYLLNIEWSDGNCQTIKDPYSFLPITEDMYLHFFNEGTNYNTYQRQGANFITHQGHEGIHFSVWAPNAKRVSLVGDFNSWDGRRNQMRVLGNSGIWEIFIPGLTANEKYKFEIKTEANDVLLKADPYAYYAENRPQTSSITYNIDTYDWSDDEWMSRRKVANHLEEPMSIYELHLGSWARDTEKDNSFLSYHKLAEKIVDYVLKMGYTHIEIMPVNEHPFDDSWGYQATGYFAPTSRFGTPSDFMHFIDHCHNNNISVIIDWVPSHFTKDAHGLRQFDGTYLYEHEDPRKGEQLDWGTLIFNFGRNEIKSFLISNALFWCKKYHIDGLRVDAVASILYLDYSRKEGEWIPNIFGGNENLEAVDFLKRFNEVIHGEFPGILTIAEESTAWTGVSKPTYLGGLGFSMKWNMGWMNDLLVYMSKDPIHRKYHHNNLTFSIMYAFSENFILVLSHDEVVHGKKALLDKMPGDEWQKFANLRLFLGFMYTHPGKKLLFMGGEIGQWREWNHHKSIDWHLLENPYHKNLQNYVSDINSLYKDEKPLWEVDFNYTGFEWIDFHDWESSIISYIRKAKDPKNYIVCVFNFTPSTRECYRVGVPEKIFYKEILNSDSTIYSGSGKGNLGGVNAEDFACQNRPYSINITIPPLSVIMFKPG